MKFLYASLCFCCFHFTYAQNCSLTIVDDKGFALENVYVINLKSKLINTTDVFGKVKLEKIKLGDTLQLSALGYKKDMKLFSPSDTIIVLENETYSLKQIQIFSENNAINELAKLDIKTAPVNSSQEILRRVPGLFIGQHAGGGKAEQLFLRGFDIDHGTDIAINVDGMPVNMVSHAHGQGYADLHFVIPEIINNIDFGKGTYYANKGDFATAGYVDFHTFDKINQHNIQVDYGKYNSFRTLGMFNLLGDSKKHNAYIATEYVKTDGFFEAKQNFNRFNIFGKYTYSMTDNSKISFQASHFNSRLNASGQIPQRSVDEGLITRFGSIDSTEGGNTSRTNLNVTFNKIISKNSFIKSNIFYSKYHFDLFSNFTFFLEDSLNGDQIRQYENRIILGINTEWNASFNNINIQVGTTYREDQTSNTGLLHTKNRMETLEILKLGDIAQENFASYLNANITLGKLKINPSLRADFFSFGYLDRKEIEAMDKKVNKMKFSPKLNIIYSINNTLQWYSKNGFGFHTNDARVIVHSPNDNVIPTAIGNDLGIILKPNPNLLFNAALWHLYLEQEFVYVGDAGVIEPSGRTRRLGIDMGLKYQLSERILFNTDINYAYARSIDESTGNNYIPLAPDLTMVNSLTLNNYKGISGGIKSRYLKSRPANEDNSIIAQGYFVTDLNINYEYKRFNFGIHVENIFDTSWNETQFATLTKLKNETESVEDIHFTPGTPRLLRFKIGVNF